MNDKACLWAILTFLFFSCKPNTQQKPPSAGDILLQKAEVCYDSCERKETIQKYLLASQSYLAQKDTEMYLYGYDCIASILTNTYQKDSFLTFLPQLIPYFSHKSSFNASVLKNVGGAYQTQGKIDSAIYFYQKAQQLLTQLPQDSEDVVFNQAELAHDYGSLYSATSDHIQALRYYKNEKYPFLKEKTDSLNYMNHCNSIGYSYFQIGQEDSALYYYRQAQQFNQEENLNETYHNLAEFYLMSNQTKIDSARKYLHKKWTLQQKLHVPKHEKGRTLKLLGEVLLAQQKYAEAIDTLNLALQFRQHQAVGMAATYQVLAETYYEQAQLQPAIKAVQKGLAYVTQQKFQGTEITQNPRIQEIIYVTEGLKLWVTKVKILAKVSPQAALIAADSADALIDKMRNTFVSDAAKLSLSEKVAKLYQQAIDLAYQQKKGEKVFYYTEKSKGFVLFSAIKNASNQSLAHISATDKEKEQALWQAYYFYQSQSQKSLKPLEIAKWNQLQLSQQVKIQQFNAYLFQKYPQYYQLKYQTQPEKLPEVQASLAPPQAILSYFQGIEQQYVMVIEAMRYTILPIQYNTQCVEDWYQYVSRKDIRLQKERLNVHLYEALIQPILAYTQTTEWTIIPENQLHLLAFDALQRNADSIESSLVYQKTISYHYSATLWNYLQKVEIQTQPRASYYFAGVPEVSYRKYLVSLKQETQAIWAKIQEIFGKGDVYSPASRHDFLKTFDSQKASYYPLVCLYTHSATDNAQPEKSWIAFSDSVVYLSDIFSLKMQSNLLILSSCESGVGKIHQGEGMMSLARGFMYAGAKSILPTKWKVEATTNHLILANLLLNLKQGMAKDKALQQAKITYLQKHPHALPSQWAATFLIGSGGVHNPKRKPFLLK